MDKCRRLPPHRKTKRVFTARDAGRVVAYARNDGANDAELLAHIAQAFGRREILCLIFQILDILNTAAFITAIVGLLSGAVTIAKALKAIQLGKFSRITLNVVTLFIPKRFVVKVAVLLIWIGGIEVAASAAIIFLTSLSNNLSLFLLMKGSCELEIRPLPVEVDDLDIGDLPEAITASQQFLKDMIDHNETNKR